MYKPKLVILDRDGVLNEPNPNDVRTPDELIVYPFAKEAVQLLHLHGINIAVATNQAVVGRGDISMDDLHAVHSALKQRLDASFITHIYAAVQVKYTEDGWRKPAPGMILEALQDFNLNPDEVIMVGDRDKDVEAATRAGVQAALVKTGHGKEQLEQGKLASYPNLWVYDDLLHAAKAIVALEV